MSDIKLHDKSDLRKETPKCTESDKLEWDWRDHFMILGTDVISLFPSLSPDNSAECIRKQVELSNIKWENIDTKELLMYMKLNEDMYKNRKVIDSIRKYLPVRKYQCRRGRKPTIASKNQGSKWVWPKQVINNSILKKLMGIGLGIAVKFLFENFIYTFGGKYFLQKKGAPIGARITMCVSHIVMQDWRDEYEVILEASKIESLMKGLYVDDGRDLIEMLRLGTRFDSKLKRFVHNRGWENLDIVNGVSRKELTKSQVLIAMNSINEDLKFTLETSEDFSDIRLPTLSFALLEEWWGINHSYYEKPVRSQVLLMEKSAMGSQAKYAILTNELRRRMEVLNDKIVDHEKVQIVDKFTQQLVNSD